MATAKRTTKDETDHFILSEDRVGGRVMRYVVRCKKCNKEKIVAGGVKHLKHVCCHREYEPTLDGEE